MGLSDRSGCKYEPDFIHKIDHDRYLIVLGSLYSSSVGNPPSYGYLQKYQVDKVLGVQERKDLTPSDFRLEQNYPNPFNPTTRIRFEVPKQGLVRLAVYDALGREVKLLIQEIKSAGVYETDFDAENLPSGVYFYRLNSGNFTETRKMMFVK